ncbi:MAG: hypothetical protein HY543_02770, partial [Deltaproteobacteria bacterium]|nr:hypothetical protein [Deltaproteobacteria bacterium]
MRSVKRFRGIGIGLGLLLAVGASGAQPPPPGQPPMPPPAPTVSPEPPAPTVPPPASQPPSVAPGETPPPGVMPAAEEMVYLNVQSGEITDIIKQISKATGRNFIIDEKVKGKITIISERPMTKEEAYQTFLSALETTGYTVVRGPSGILKIVPLDRVEQRPIPTHVDTTPATDSYITRVIKLNNINPQEMANAIQPLTKGKIYPSNITNTLILTDSGANIDRLMKIIKELDREGPQQVLEIIPIRNANAKDIAAMVQNLFLEQEKARAKPKPGEPEEIPEVSKIVPDDRTNSVIVIASKRHIDHVRAIVARLDARVAEGQEGKIHVYNVKYARAKALAETLSNLTAGAGASKPAGGATPTTGAPRIAELEGGVKVGYDEATNALLVTASAKDFKTLVDRVISKLDVLRRQVYLEAVVMELRINKQRTLGVAAHGGGGGNVIGFGQSFGAIPALQGSFLTGGATAPALLGGLISRQTVAVNVINPADGTTKAINIPAFSAFLSALSSYGDANIISTPNLLTLDNEPAEIEVRREEPVPGQQTIQANIAVAGP